MEDKTESCCGLVFPIYNWIIGKAWMKNSSSKLNLMRGNRLHAENHKEEHYSYFQNLEHKLLTSSDKLTSLISPPANTYETRSLQNSIASSNSTHKPKPSTSKMHERTTSPSLEKHEQYSSLSLQSYLQGKKFQVCSKSQQGDAKQRESQMKRKFTYNVLLPMGQTQSEYSYIHGRAVSPSQSDKMKDNLKKTASSTSSAVLKTIDKIKKLHNLGTRSSIKPKGLSIQDFKILKYLQQGQFGSVYLSMHKDTKMVVALKRIPKKIFDGQPKFLNQLVRQIKIQSFLDHPNIVQLYGFFSDEEFLYLVLEPCCGGNAYSALKKQGRFSEEKAKNMVRQICHAIQFMHDNDIIHRDIKPQNILLHEGIIKVCDFGWSIYSPLLRDTRCGTPLYSSPEVIQKQQYDNKVDIWNIGILTYQILIGRVPFEIRKEEDLVKVVDEDIYFPKTAGLSSIAKEFILKCLHKNPKERISMARLVDHPFVQV